MSLGLTPYAGNFNDLAGTSQIGAYRCRREVGGILAAVVRLDAECRHIENDAAFAKVLSTTKEPSTESVWGQNVPCRSYGANDPFDDCLCNLGLGLPF